LLDLETVGVLVERDLSFERLDAFILEAEARSAAAADPDASPNAGRIVDALFRLLAEYGAAHPSSYRQLRAFLVRMAVLAKADGVRESAAASRERLEQGFRAWLGAPTRIAVDPETGHEYRWEDVVVFADDVDEEARKRLLAALKGTPMLREAVFLFSGATVIRLEDILPGGVWVRLIGEDHGKSVYRIGVKTRDQDQFDIAVNVNREMSPDAVRWEIAWLIICGEDRIRAPIVEAFGGYWPDQDLWTEEFIAGETLDRALRKLSRRKGDEERYLTVWPYAAWSGLSAYVDLWDRTGEANPTPGNVVVPMHDYHTGARLVSISSRQPYASPLAFLKAMWEQFVRPVEEAHAPLRGQVGWDVVFSSVLETLGVEEGTDFLRQALSECEGRDEGEMSERLDRYVANVERRGFFPKRLYFATKRYRRWAELNPDATLHARAATLQELYETYRLSRVQEEYPEIRVRFFQRTVFRDAPPPLAEGLGDLVQRLRRRELAPEEVSSAIADLRAQLPLDPDSDYFLTRLSYPYLRPEDEAEFVAAQAGGTQQSEMVVTLEDADGNPYRIRHALSPKEVGKLHRLFLAAKLDVQFRPEHRFLVAISDRGHLVGGLFYEVQEDAHSAHMDKIVVAERFQGKGVAGALLEELCNRLRTAGVRSLTTGFFRPQFFYRNGFTVERRYAGLVRSLE
jgi:GNAT superfamily N-acetyltransferase